MTPDHARHLRWIPSSPILRRILAINVLALGILVAGLMYHDQYRESLVESELAGLSVHAEIIAAALGESAIENAVTGEQLLRPSHALQMVRRLVETTGGRARLFAPDGILIADSLSISASGSHVQSVELPAPDSVEDKTRGLLNVILDAYEWLIRLFPGGGDMPPYLEGRVQHASDYGEVVSALYEKPLDGIRRTDNGGMMLITAVPLKRYKQVLGALMLSRGSDDIEAALREVRVDILRVFGIALAVTIMLSLYLASTIARPIRLLAEAAERVRHGHHRQHAIPDLDDRNDEIGELASALKEMTEALWARMDAIESFAADVSHEIKNPLTSLKSAVETASRITDPEQQRKLMDIILDDVHRMDRLISDISDASRLDAELSRAEMSQVDLKALLSSLIEANSNASGLSINLKAEGEFIVNGIESRLGQVFANLLNNAVSFSPPDSKVSIYMTGDDKAISIIVDDEGPGIPAGKLDAIFERFYSSRPESEKFGTHSGLGLSISKLIVEAHEGSIRAEKNSAMGARFIVDLPRS